MGKHTYTTEDGVKYVFDGTLEDFDNIEKPTKETQAKLKIQKEKDNFTALTDKEKINIISKKLGLE
jgi:hypothetical protein|tara:strand:- start:80 stop:277 length:198 start_codon:yes stop_codon:yes gene_type:complete